MRHTTLDIFRYTDLRAFIRDRIDELKAGDSRFSRRWLCRKLNLKSPSYLKLIIDGKRSLTPPVARKMAEVLGLNRQEAAFFLDLAHYTQAATAEEQASALDDLRRHRRFVEIHQLELAAFDYLTSPLTLALRELVNTAGFREDPAWIGSRLAFSAGRAEIVAAIQRLLDLGLFARDADGRLVTPHLQLMTGDRLGSVPLRTYHRKMLAQAAHTIDLPPDTRYLRGYTMTLSPEGYRRILAEYDGFLDRVKRIVHEDDAPEGVYHAEFALFPLAGWRTEPKEKDDEA